MDYNTMLSATNGNTESDTSNIAKRNGFQIKITTIKQGLHDDFL